MKEKRSPSKKTRMLWQIDLVLFLSALLASLSGLYFLYFVSGGYQGGRNASYAISLLFSRENWDLLHTWGGMIMIVAALVHVMIHWNWVMSMGRRMLRELLGKVPGMNWPARKNLLINAVIAFSFTLTALSGVVFVFFPGSGADHSTVDFLFPRGGWDMIHTWAGVVMILSSIVHFMIHWRWVVNVTLMIFRSSESQLSVR